MMIGIDSNIAASDRDCLGTVKTIGGASPEFIQSARAMISKQLGPFRFAAKPVGRFLGVDAVERLYFEARSRPEPTFEARLLAQLEAEMDWDPSQLAHFPKTGPVIVAAVHPTGPRESVITEAVRATGRTDIKIMTTIMLSGIPEIADYAIFVDNLGTPAPKKRAKPGQPKSAEEIEYERKRDERRAFNKAARDEAEAWVKAGHVLIIFPAGAVSYFQPTKGKVLDPKWLLGLAQFVRASEATVVPAFFGGRNSFGFQFFGQIPDVRTMLLFRELLNKKGKKFSLLFGEPIPFSRLNEFEDDREMVDYVRAQTYALAIAKRSEKHRTKMGEPRDSRNFRGSDPIDIRPQMQELISRVEAAEASQAPLPTQLLVRSKERMVFVFHGNEMPQLIEKLGDRRAVNFWRVGEGNGERDNDLIDLVDDHIVSYNLANNEIEGAYRIGVIPEIWKKFGPEGVYIHQFLKFHPSIVDRGFLKYTAELGRAFIEEKYEGETLYPLWKGIAEYLYRKKDIMFLTGVVSMSATDYTPTEQLLAIRFMQDHFPFESLENEFKPRTPPKFPRADALIKEILAKGTHSLDDVERVTGRKLPPLFGFYANNGARFLRPNHDRAFKSIDLPVVMPVVGNPSSLVKRTFGMNRFKEMQTHWNSLLDSDPDFDPAWLPADAATSR